MEISFTLFSRVFDQHSPDWLKYRYLYQWELPKSHHIQYIDKSPPPHRGMYQRIKSIWLNKTVLCDIVSAYPGLKWRFSRKKTYFCWGFIVSHHWFKFCQSSSSNLNRAKPEKFNFLDNFKETVMTKPQHAIKEVSMKSKIQW